MTGSLLRLHSVSLAIALIARVAFAQPARISTSPGPTPTSEAANILQFANMWRVSGDFWDRWKDLNHQFDLLASWQDVGGPGHWPDADMIPIGHLGIKCTIAGGDRQTLFTPEEQRTLMSLWAMSRTWKQASTPPHFALCYLNDLLPGTRWC